VDLVFGAITVLGFSTVTHAVFRKQLQHTARNGGTHRGGITKGDKGGGPGGVYGGGEGAGEHDSEEEALLE